MLATLVWIIALILVVGFLWWVLQKVALPEMARTLILILVGLVVLILVVKMLFGLVGAPPGL